MASLLSEAVVKIKTDHSGVAQGLNAVKGQVMGWGSSLMGVATGFGAMVAGALAVKAGLSAFTAAEEKTARLKASFEAAGAPVDEAMNRFKQFKTVLQEHTTVSGGTVSEMYNLALAMGVPEGNIQSLATAAVGLGRAFGMDATEAMQMLAKESQGVSSRLNRQIPALTGVTDQTQRLAIIQAAAAKGMAQEEAISNTIGGQWTHLEHELAKISVTVGSIFAPAMRAGVAIMRGAVEFVQGLIDKFSAIQAPTKNITALFTKWFGVLYGAGGVFQNLAGAAASGIGTVIGWVDQAAAWVMQLAARVYAVSPSFDTLWQTVQSVFANIGTAIATAVGYVGSLFSDLVETTGTTWGGILDFLGQAVGVIWGYMKDAAYAVLNWDLTVKEVGISIAEAWDNVVARAGWLADNIGVFLSWLSDNWTDVWQTIVSYATAIFSNHVDNLITIASNIGEIFANMAANVKNIFSELWKYISSWGKEGLDFKLVPLMKEQLKELTDGAQNFVKTAPEFKAFQPPHNYDEQRAEMQKEWGEREDAWNNAQVSKPLKIDNTKLEVGPIKASQDIMGQQRADKEKEKDNKDVGKFSSLGDAFKRAQQTGDKDAEKRHKESMKKQEETTKATQGVEGQLKRLNKGLGVP